MVQSWEALRKEARRLETEIDSKLLDYSKVASTLQASSSSSRPSFEVLHSTTEDEAIQRRPTHDRREAAANAEAMTNDMDALLSKLSAVIDTMSSIQQESHHGANAHTLQRHSEILSDYQQEFRKTRNSITARSEHAELLSSSDDPGSVAADGSGSGGGAGVPGSGSENGLNALYKERASIGNASATADTAINTGLNLKEDLDRQRAMFASMVERMETMSEGLPAVNRLIGQIRRKKKRDVLIMAVVVSTLLFITFVWKVLG